MEYDFINGEVLLIDKPPEWTSFDVVKKIRATISRETGIRGIKVGHAGTLDPLATGLLILCTGKFTKKIDQFMGMEKQYTGTIFLGATTASFDRETEINEIFPVDHLSEEMIIRATADFTGEIEQVPPVFSAVKHKGSRAYFYARSNEPVKLNSRKVHIRSFEITNLSMPEIDFAITCSKGTYIRALARDFGIALGTGAYLTALKRTRIGSFALEEAITPEQFVKKLQSM